MESAKHDITNQKTIESINSFHLPEWFIYPLKYDDSSCLTFEQIMVLFDWYELKMNTRVNFKLISVSEPFEGITREIESSNENETLCNFTFLSTKINNYKKPKTKVKLFTFVNENENETFAVFVDKTQGENMEVFSNINKHCSNYSIEYLKKCDRPTQAERNLLISEMRAIGYNVEEI